MTNEYQKYLTQFEERRRKIVAAFKGGMSAVQVAKAFGISRARVYQIVHQERTNGNDTTTENLPGAADAG